MNRKGEIELKDMGVTFLIYILLMTTIATSTDIQISDNSSLPQPQELPQETPQEIQSNQTDQEEPLKENTTSKTPQESNSSKQESEENKTKVKENQTIIEENKTNIESNTTESLIENQTKNNSSCLNTTSPLNQNETNKTLLNKSQTNQIISLVEKPLNETTLRTELIQLPAVVGENVRWIKRVYTNDTSYKIQIPKNAKEIIKSESNFKTHLFSATSAITNQSQEYQEIIYETPAPKKLETNLSKGKEVLIYSEDHLQNVTVNISISSFNLTESKRDSISLYWVEENKYLDFNTTNNNNDSILDEMTWVVPHLSNQTFKIIIITKASLLDKTRNFLEDIFDFVSQLDGVLKDVLVNQYVRITFEKNLTNKNDIIIYAKSNNSGFVEVYEKNGTKKLGELGPIESKLKKYQLLLTKLDSPQDTFDLKVIGATVFFDLVIDPIVTDVTSIAQIYQNGVLQDLDTETSIDFNQETIVGSKFSHPSNSVLQFQEDGWYKISYGCLVEETAAAGNRQIQSMWLEDGAGTEILPSRTYTYLRNDADGQGDFASMSAVTLVNASLGDNLTVQSAAIHGTRDIDPEESCWLYAEKLHRPAVLARETTDYDNQLTTSSQITQDLGDTVYEDADEFTVDLNNNWITVKSDGWYKIYYVGSSEQTVGSNDNDRVTPASCLYKNNATEIEPSMTYSYHKRADTADFSSEEGYTMAYLSSGENVSLRRFLLKDQATTPGQTYTIKDSWLMLEKIDGSDILALWDTSGGQQITGSAATKTAFSNITWDSQAQVGAYYSHTLGSEAFTIDEDGWFEISYAVSFDGTVGSNRKVSCARVTQDGNPLEPSHLCEYERDNLVAENSVAGNFVVNNTAGMTYTVQQAVTPQSNGGGHNLIADSSWVTVTPIKILDVTSPNVSIISPTQTNYTTQNIWFKVSANDSKEMDSCWYNIDNGANITMSNSLDIYSHQNTSVLEGSHVAYFFCNDTSGNINGTEKVSFGTDAAAPTINFELPTPQNSTTSGNSFFTINTTIVETNLKDVTYFLYNSTGLVNQTSYTTLTESITFQNLPTENYFYNVTVVDKIGQSTSTETRTIYIDSQSPNVEFSGATKLSGEIISGDEITSEVSVIEPNEKNITFSLYGPETLENTYINSKRLVTWTLLPDGFYEYNVTVFDTYNHSNSTETRNITLDNQKPIIVYTNPTKPNNSYTAQNFIFINSSTQETYFQNITFSLANSSGMLNQTTYTNPTNQINFTNLANGVYQYNITVYDRAGNFNTSQTRTITLDTITPLIDFAAPTSPDYTNLSQNWMFINSTITETNFQNITFYLYDETGLVNQTTLDFLSYINFSNLDSKIYYYNMTVYDKAGNFNTSQTRQIGLDLKGPSININSPQSKAYGTDTGLSLDATTTDSISGVDSCWYNLDNTANVSTTCNTPTTFDTTDGTHTLYYFSNDTFSNIGEAQVTFLISTTGPAISLDLPENDTFYSSSTSVFFNYSTIDPDGVDTCSLYGDWNGGWHKNQTDTSFGLIGDSSIRTCSQTWPALDCGASPLSAEGDNTWDSCTSQGTIADESIEEMWITATETIPGKTLDVTCYIDPYGTSNEIYMWYYNGTGWKTLYSGSAPSSSNYNLTQSFTVDDVLGTQWVRCGIGYNADDVSDFCVNAGSYFDNDDINFTVVAAKESGNFTVDLSSEGNYNWNVECNDSLSYYTSALNNFTLAIDLTAPIVAFGPGTLANDSRTSLDQIYVNTSITENNLANITFYLYNSTFSQIRSDTTSSLDITWNSLPDGIYYYNFTATDKAARSTSSQTRKLEIDTILPTGTNTAPSHNSYTNIMLQNFTAVVGDLVELKDATLFIYNSTNGLVYSSLVSLAGLTSATIGQVYTFLYDDVFSWFYQVKDSVDNEYNTTASTITIDRTLPQITFISPTSLDNEVVLQDFIIVNTSVYEANFQNITFSLFDSNGLLFEKSYSDSTRHINWTTLPNGIYKYNVTVFDKAGNNKTSQTRTITLDTIPPILSFSGSTKPNDSTVTGGSITLEVTATEPNEQNITFNLYGQESREITYLDGRRSLTWTLLPEGEYFYNVTMIDKVGLSGSTQTRKITLDNTPPVVDYTSPTEASGANKSRNWIFINTSVTETNFQNITFSLYNQTSFVSSQTYTDTTRHHNFTNLPDGNYFYNVTVSDKASQESSTSTRKINLDTTSPITSFISPTENTGAIKNRDWVFLNTSVTETNFKQITFYIYNSQELVDSQTYTDTTRYHNFTNLPDGNYFYNATTLDWAGNKGSTQTRTIGLDGAGPIVTITKPRPKTYGYNESLPLEHTVTDQVSSVDSCWWNIDNGVNQSIACNSQTTFNTTVATHTIYFFANDTFGNIGSDSTTFYISITGPAVELVNPENNTFFGQATLVNFSFAAADPDGVDTCSIYGDWNGGWHKNETYSGGWQDIGFKHRKDISISNTGSTKLTNLPTYINIPSEYTSTGDYSDIKFFNGSCSENQSVLLAYELETYNSTSADFWLRVPEIPLSGQTICIYYGNDNAEDSTNSTGVWNSDYGIVYHMDMAGQDSTSNNRDKVANIGTPSADNSFLGYGVAFSSGNAWSLADISYWEAGYSTRTHEAVFETSTDVSTRQVILAEGGGTNGIMMYIYNGDLYARWWISAQDNYVSYPISSNTKYHAVMTYENPGNYALYINGELVGSGATSFAIAAHSGNGGIGYTGSTSKDFEDANSLQGHYFLGSIYEVRVKDVFETQDEANQTYQSIFNQQSTIIPQTEENFTAFQIPIAEEGTYQWNMECNDTIGYTSSAQTNFSFIVDVTNPQVFFGTKTKDNDSVVGSTWVFADANIIENNFQNITFYIYNSTNLIKKKTYSDSTREYNFTNLASGTYYYNITVYDQASHVGVSQTRQISLDLSPPTANLNTPANDSFQNSLSQNLTATFSDATGLLNATLFILNETGQIIYTQIVELSGALEITIGTIYNFVSEGIYSWFYQVEDLVGNSVNTTANKITIDTTSPLIDFATGTEESGVILERENIFVNTTSSDKYWENISFNLYTSTGQIFSNTFSDGTKNINWTNLPDETYFYNVTAYDKAGNKNSTETRNITLDNLYPTIDFSPSTKPDASIISGDRISLGVSVVEANEANITFNLYNETGYNIKSNIYTTPQRGLTWNLISEGTYYYNVTVVDRLSHSASTLTRSITLDDTAPTIDYGFGTLPNDSYVNQDWIYIKTTITDAHFQNVTFYLYNSTGEQGKAAFTDTTREINFTGLIDSQYWYKVESCDQAANCNTSQTRYATLDSKNPLIEFSQPTKADNFNKTENSIFINTSIQDTNFQNVTFALYDQFGLINQTTKTSQTYINFTNLESKVYWYNVSTVDKAGNQNSTETRKIGIDYLGPSISILSPQAKAYGYNESLSLIYLVTDAIVGTDTCWYNLDHGSNITTDCSNPTTFDTSDGSHTLYFFANDTFSNLGQKNVTFLVSTTGPAIQLVAPEDNSFYSQATQIFFNYTAEDPDLTESCSLYGDWNGGWHKNQTDTNWIFTESGTTSDDFESDFGDWTVDGGSCTWTRDSGGTPSTGTGPGASSTTGFDHTIGTTAGYYIYTETSSSVCQGSDTQSIITSGDLDADTYNYNITFWFHMYGANMGDLHLDVYNGTWNNDVWLQSGQNQTTGTDPFIFVAKDLSEYSGVIRVRFRLDSVGGYTSDATLDDIQINYINSYNKPSGNFTLNLSEEGTSQWNVLCNDTLGYTTSAVSNFSVTFDVTDPIVDFGANTLPDNSNVSQDYIYVNSSIIENNYKNMTFYLYNQTSLVTTKFYNDTTRAHSFTNLQDGTYYYNITVFDKASRSGNSPTRKILLDTTQPTGSPTSPANNLITNNATQNLTAAFSDESGLSSVVLYIFNQTGLIYTQFIPLAGELSATIGTVYEFLSDGIYTWFYQAEDTIGNKFNITNSTIKIDTTLPQITFVEQTLPNNTFIQSNYIYINTSVIETNFKNITFSLYSQSGLEEYSFTNSKRDINYTLLPDAEYYYNVTVYDSAQNSNTSQTRKITLDNIAPVSTYKAPTEVDFANKSQSFIFINTSTTEINFANITFNLYLGDTLLNKTTYSTKTESINFTGLSDGTYYYNVTVSDKAGLKTNLPTRKITLDKTKPIIFFIAPTEDSGVSLEQETISLNTFITDANFKNITFYLYNQTALLNKTTYQTQTSQIQFNAPGTNVTYFYNATVYDIAGNKASTTTRNITLIDTTYPTLSITSPENKTYSYNTSIRISYNAYDLHLEDCWYSLDNGANITLPNCQGVTIDVSDEKSHTVVVYANDTLGYEASDNVTFFTNSSLIKIPEEYSVQRGSIFTDGTSFQSISETSPTKGFILHTVRSSDNSPAALQVSSDFSDPEKIVFKNYDSGSGAVVDWSLVSGPNITVQRGEISFTNELSISTSITQVDLSNSFIIINGRLNSTDSSKNVDGFWTAKFIDDSNVNFTRGSSLASGSLSYQIVTWQGVNVQSSSSLITGTSTSAAISTNKNNSFLIFSRRITGTTSVQDSMIKGEIKNNSFLEFQRTGSSGEVLIESFTVESNLFESQHGNYDHLITSSAQYENIPNQLINTSRAFDTHSNNNSGTTTSFATASITQNVFNKTAIELQKGIGSGAGTTSWGVIEIKELRAPEITLLSPLDTQNFSTYTIPSFNFSISDDSEIINCSLYGNWSGGWHKNQTMAYPTKEQIINFSSITVDSDNFYSWNVECTDAYQNTGFSQNNFTFASFLPPTSPTVYSINQTSNDGTGNVILLWNASNHSIKYEIYAGATISSMSYINETNNKNYTDTLFSGEKRKFYQIRAINPIGQNNSGIFSAHLYELKHNLLNSKNWIAIPANFTNIPFANNTLSEIPQATSLTEYNSTSQSRVTCNSFSCPETLSCTPTNCNFEIKSTPGYELTINTSGPQEVNWSAVGEVYAPSSIDLVKKSGDFGKNWISVDANTSITDSQNLIINIPNSDAISRWNPSTQKSEGLIPSPFPWIPGFIGKNFQVNPEEGYEVSVTLSEIWNQN